eukprot:tig00000900_g5352.t1
MIEAGASSPARVAGAPVLDPLVPLHDPQTAAGFRSASGEPLPDILGGKAFYDRIQADKEDRTRYSIKDPALRLHREPSGSPLDSSGEPCGAEGKGAAAKAAEFARPLTVFGEVIEIKGPSVVGKAAYEARAERVVKQEVMRPTVQRYATETETEREAALHLATSLELRDPAILYATGAPRPLAPAPSSTSVSRAEEEQGGEGSGGSLSPADSAEAGSGWAARSAWDDHSPLDGATASHPPARPPRGARPLPLSLALEAAVARLGEGLTGLEALALLGGSDATGGAGVPLDLAAPSTPRLNLSWADSPAAFGSPLGTAAGSGGAPEMYYRTGKEVGTYVAHVTSDARPLGSRLVGERRGEPVTIVGERIEKPAVAGPWRMQEGKWVEKGPPTQIGPQLPKTYEFVDRSVVEGEPAFLTKANKCPFVTLDGGPELEGAAGRQQLGSKLALGSGSGSKGACVDSAPDAFDGYRRCTSEEEEEEEEEEGGARTRNFDEGPAGPGARGEPQRQAQEEGTEREACGAAAREEGYRALGATDHAGKLAHLLHRSLEEGYNFSGEQATWRTLFGAAGEADAGRLARATQGAARPVSIARAEEAIRLYDGTRLQEGAGYYGAGDGDGKLDAREFVSCGKAAGPAAFQSPPSTFVAGDAPPAGLLSEPEPNSKPAPTPRAKRVDAEDAAEAEAEAEEEDGAGPAVESVILARGPPAGAGAPEDAFEGGYEGDADDGPQGAGAPESQPFASAMDLLL